LKEIKYVYKYLFNLKKKRKNAVTLKNRVHYVALFLFLEYVYIDYVKHISNIRESRKLIRKRTEEQADLMMSNCAKRRNKAEVGATVRIRVPDVDRGRTDHLNVLGLVMDVRNDLYQIGT